MASSLYDDNVFATAHTFTDVLHSTPQQGNTAHVNLNYDQFPDSSDHSSDGSRDMSVEIGRGLKRAVRETDDASSNALFGFVNENSQYEVTGSPAIRPRAATRKADGAMRKEASVRRATESARASDALKKNHSGAKKRAVSDNAAGVGRNEVLQDNTQPTATFQVRGSRFSRQVSSTYSGLPNRFTTDRGLQLGQGTPRRPSAAVNATVQSATYTSQSFMLPDIPDITELVSGVQKHATPMVRRGLLSRSRFTSASYRPHPLPDIPVTAMRVPEEEKAIYAGIQLLHDKNIQLETANSEAQKHAEECENEVIQLRTQLHVTKEPSVHRAGPDKEGTVQARTSTDQARLQAKVKTLQEQLDRAERKISISEITVSRVTKERDALITQIGTSYFNNEELAIENELFRESYAKLQEENDDCKELVRDLQNENSELRDQLQNAGSTQRHKKGSARQDTTALVQESNNTNMTRHTEEGLRSRQNEQHVRRRSDVATRDENRSRLQDGPTTDDMQHHRSSVHTERTFTADLAGRIENEVKKRREEAKTQNEQNGCDDKPQPGNFPTRSESQGRKETGNNARVSLKRHVSGPVDNGVQGDGPTSELNSTRHRRKSIQDVEYDGQDLTVLSDVDELAIADLRRRLEAERQAKRQERQDLTHDLKRGNLMEQSIIARQKLPRKSSLKDLTGRIEDETGRLSLHGETIDDILKATKTVRVQSPHSSQIEPEQQLTQVADMSVLSNTSRRRRRAESTDGATSAFIIPDITLHGKKTALPVLERACIQHDIASCTICAADHSQIEIDMPVPVTDRPGYGDETNATIRPAQQPAIALAIVIRNLTDEVTHLKIRREQYNRLYNQLDPALSKRRRQDVKLNIDRLTTEIEKRSDQVYKLYDVLEGQKQAAQLQADDKEAARTNQEELAQTLQSLEIDPVELSGKVGRKAPVRLNEDDDLSEDGFTGELPWEGLSDIESEAEVRGL